MRNMPMKPDDIKQLVKEALPDASIELVDTAGDGDHYSITVTSAAFQGKSRVEQHRMVTGALGAKMGTTLHALQVTTRVA
jgi:stress-induced morphogen